MITSSDVSSLFDISGTPPTAKRIAELRREYSRATPMTPGSVSYGIAVCSPFLLGLELIPALGAAAVEACLPDPLGDLLTDRPLASEREWTGVAGDYVRAVRAMGRPLVSAEVDMLTAHGTVGSLVSDAMSLAKRSIFG